MKESPEFSKAKAEGKTSTNPLKESFGNRYNLKFVLLALFGAAMGQGVVWYTGQFYSMSFMKTVMHLQSDQADTILGIALLLGTPFFVVFGWLSDKIGRKWIMLGGMLLAVLTRRPTYDSMYQLANITQKVKIAEQIELPTTDQNPEIISITKNQYDDGTEMTSSKSVHLAGELKGQESIKTTIHLAGTNYVLLIVLIFIQVIYITMVYGPIAAFLVELFPVKIRYTSMSLPYHVGNGIFGGLLPAVSTYLTTNAETTNTPQFYLAGLWYPIIIAVVCFVIGSIYIKNNSTPSNHE